MRRFDCVRLAAGNVFRHGLRAGLCVVSVAIGILSVTLISAMGETGRQVVSEQLDTLGISGLSVYIKDKKSGQALPAFAAQDIGESIPEVSAALPVLTRVGKWRTDRGSGAAVVWGVGDSFGRTLKVELLAGRLPSAQDIKYSARVAVVDENLAKSLYKRTNIVGKNVKISINGQEDNYKVIGVIRPQTGAAGAFLGASMPAFLYVPYTVVTDSGTVDQIMLRLSDKADIDAVGKRVKRYLEGPGGLKGEVTVANMSGYLGTVKAIASILAFIFSFVAGISLFVAAVGVASSMLSAASERRREIGIYMALGATRGEILTLFLLESVFICGTGGLLGGGIGIALLQLGVWLTGFSLQAGWGSAAAALFSSMLCGALAGVFPALRAAHMNPIDALRQ